jgi:hypothetical protein
MLAANQASGATTLPIGEEHLKAESVIIPGRHAFYFHGRRILQTRSGGS